MTAKQFVKSRYPLATVERYKYNGPGNRGYNLVWSKSQYSTDTIRLGEGDTAANAWEDAKENLIEYETSLTK